MLFYKTDEEFKAAIEHDIEWNKGQIKRIKEGDKKLQEFLSRTSDAGSIRSARSFIKKSSGYIKAHQGFIANAQEGYVKLCGHRYGCKPKRPPAGKPGLTVIKGAKGAGDGLSDEFRAWRDRNA